MDEDGCVEGYVPNARDRYDMLADGLSKPLTFKQAMTEADEKEELLEELPFAPFLPATLPPTKPVLSGRSFEPKSRQATSRAVQPSAEHVSVYLEPGDGFEQRCEEGDNWRRISYGIHQPTRVTKDTTLIFSKVTTKETGVYVCSLKERKVLVLSITVLNQKVSTKIKAAAQIGSDVSRTGRLGGPVTMFCLVEPANFVSGKWSRENGKPLSNATIIDGDRLHIEHVNCSEAGRYYCTVDKKLARQEISRVVLRVYDNENRLFC